MNIFYEQIFADQKGPVSGSNLILGGNSKGETLIYIAAGECSDSSGSILIKEMKPQLLKASDGSNKVISNFLEITYSVAMPSAPDNIVSYPQAVFRVKISAANKFLFRRV